MAYEQNEWITDHEDMMSQIENLRRDNIEMSQVARLDYPKCAILTDADRSEQLIKSAMATYFHVHVCQQIENHIGSGDPLDTLLRDMHHRAKFNLEPRKI
jgi:hypothetical protein